MRRYKRTFGEQVPPAAVVIQGEINATEIEIDCLSVIRVWPMAFFEIRVGSLTDSSVRVAATQIAADEKGRIQYVLTEQDTAVAQDIVFEVRAITLTGSVLISWPFIVQVEANIGAVTIAPTPATQAAVWTQNIYDAASSALAAKAGAEAAEDAARSVLREIKAYRDEMLGERGV